MQPAGPGAGGDFRYGSDMVASAVHPTRERLLSTVVDMLDRRPAQEVTASAVLRVSGVSSGSLYHFFEGMPDLLEQALLRRFSIGVAATTKAIVRLVENSRDKEGFLTGLERITKRTQDRSLRQLRLERARILVMCEASPRMTARVTAVQQQLTDDLTAAFSSAQAKGWLNTTFEPRTGAVFIQAYTLGRIVDDFVEVGMNDSDWQQLIGRIARTALSDPS
jgi:AcrR family transcriptional regulator